MWSECDIAIRNTMNTSAVICLSEIIKSYFLHLHWTFVRRALKLSLEYANRVHKTCGFVYGKTP